MSQFEGGDVVRLRSGGPKMTIQEVIETGGNIRCQWFGKGALYALRIGAVSGIVFFA
jgi:uncharacterized protein YodC (DUF2158 family)